jgi:hypothetical protein
LWTAKTKIAIPEDLRLKPKLSLFRVQGEAKIRLRRGRIRNEETRL